VNTTVPLNPEPDTYGCACSLMEGRCDKHATMMRDIHEFWNSTDDAGADVIRDHADGYGFPGSMHELGTYDWSGVRDSSATQVEAMHAAMTAHKDGQR
jgi:hypothetical protein